MQYGACIPGSCDSEVISRRSFVMCVHHCICMCGICCLLLMHTYISSLCVYVLVQTFFCIFSIRRSNLAVATRVYVTRIMTQGDTAIGMTWMCKLSIPLHAQCRDNTIACEQIIASVLSLLSTE